MPQTTIEKKYFLARIDRFLQQSSSIIRKKLVVAEFQEFKVFLKNIMAGGEE